MWKQIGDTKTKFFHTIVYLHYINEFEVEGDRRVAKIALDESGITLKGKRTSDKHIPSFTTVVPQPEDAKALLVDTDREEYQWKAKPAKYHPCYLVEKRERADVVDAETGAIIGYIPYLSFLYSAFGSLNYYHDINEQFKGFGEGHNYFVPHDSAAFDYQWLLDNIVAKQQVFAFLVGHACPPFMLIDTTGGINRYLYSNIAEDDWYHYSLPLRLIDRPKFTYVTLFGCNSLSLYGSDAFGHVWRKESNDNTFILGLSRVSYVLLTQLTLFHYYLVRGYSFKQAFDEVLAESPEYYIYETLYKVSDAGSWVNLSSLTYLGSGDPPATYEAEVNVWTDWATFKQQSIATQVRFQAKMPEGGYDSNEVVIQAELKDGCLLRVDSGSGANNASAAAGLTWRAQTFTTDEVGHVAEKAILRLYRLGLPGTCRLSIRATDPEDNHKPIGNDLAHVDFNGNNLQEGSGGIWGALKELSISCALSANTKYAVVLRAPNGDGENICYWACGESGYHEGHEYKSLDGGNAWISQGTDESDENHILQVYGGGWESIYNGNLTKVQDDSLISKDINIEAIPEAIGYRIKFKSHYAGTIQLYRFENKRHTLVYEGDTSDTFKIFESWLSPVSHAMSREYPWTNPDSAYDDDLTTYAQADHTEYIIFNCPSILCDKVRIYPSSAIIVDNKVPNVQVGVWYDDAFHEIFSGDMNYLAWNEVAISAGSKLVTKVYVRMTSCPSGQEFYLHGVQLHKTCQKLAVTTSSEAFDQKYGDRWVLTLPGSIDDIKGATVFEKGFLYHKEGEEAQELKRTGYFGAGDFSLQSDPLEGGNLYYYKAYAINAKGTDYGSEMQFRVTIPKAVTGTLTSIGTVLKNISKNMSSYVFFFGVLNISHTIYKAVLGVLNSVGALAKLPKKMLAGGSTPTGALAKEAKKMLSGVLTSSSTLIKDVEKGAVGVLSSSGALAVGHTFEQAISGVLSLAGALGRYKVLITQACAGTLTSAGSLVKDTSLGVAGVLTSAGAVVKQTSRNCIGHIWHLGGALHREIEKAVSGGITPTGVLTTLRFVFKAVAGVIESAGVLVKTTGKSFTGAVTSVGATTKLIQLSIDGVVSLAGTTAKAVSKGLTGVLLPLGQLISRRPGAVTHSLSFNEELDTTLTFTEELDTVIKIKGGG